MFAETFDVLSKVLESLSEAVGLRVSRTRTKVQAVCDIMNATIKSFHLSGEIVEVRQTFAKLRSVSHPFISCKEEVKLRLEAVWRATKSQNELV